MQTDVPASKKQLKMTGVATFNDPHPMVGGPYQGSIVKSVKEKVELKPNGRIKQSLEIYLQNGMIFTESRWLAKQDLVDPEETEQQRKPPSTRKSASVGPAPSVPPGSEKGGGKTGDSTRGDGGSGNGRSRPKSGPVEGDATSCVQTQRKEGHASMLVTPSEEESALLPRGAIKATSMPQGGPGTDIPVSSNGEQDVHDEIQEVVPASSPFSRMTSEASLKVTTKKPASSNSKLSSGTAEQEARAKSTTEKPASFKNPTNRLHPVVTGANKAASYKVESTSRSALHHSVEPSVKETCKETISGSSGHKKLPPSERLSLPQSFSPTFNSRKTNPPSGPSTPESPSSGLVKMTIGGNSGHKKVLATHQWPPPLSKKLTSPKKPESFNGGLGQFPGSPIGPNSLRSPQAPKGPNSLRSLQSESHSPTPLNRPQSARSVGSSASTPNQSPTSVKVVKTWKLTDLELDEIVPVPRTPPKSNKLFSKQALLHKTKLGTHDGIGGTDVPPSRNVSMGDTQPMTRAYKPSKTGKTTGIDSIGESTKNEDAVSDMNSALDTVKKKQTRDEGEVTGEAVIEVTRKVYGFRLGDSIKQKVAHSYVPVIADHVVADKGSKKQLTQEIQSDDRGSSSLLVSSEISEDNDDSINSNCKVHTIADHVVADKSSKEQLIQKMQSDDRGSSSPLASSEISFDLVPEDEADSNFNKLKKGKKVKKDSKKALNASKKGKKDKKTRKSMPSHSNLEASGEEVDAQSHAKQNRELLSPKEKFDILPSAEHNLSQGYQDGTLSTSCMSDAEANILNVTYRYNDDGASPDGNQNNNCASIMEGHVDSNEDSETTKDRDDLNNVALFCGENCLRDESHDVETSYSMGKFLQEKQAKEDLDPDKGMSIGGSAETDGCSLGAKAANPETFVSTKKKEGGDELTKKSIQRGQAKKKAVLDSIVKDKGAIDHDSSFSLKNPDHSYYSPFADNTAVEKHTIKTKKKSGDGSKRENEGDLLRRSTGDCQKDDGSDYSGDVDFEATIKTNHVGSCDSPTVSQTPPRMLSLVESSHDKIALPPPIATKSKGKLQHCKKSVDPNPGFAKIMGIWGARESKAKDAIPFSPLKPESKVDDSTNRDNLDSSIREGRAKLCNIFNSRLEVDPDFQPPVFEKTEKDRDLIRQSFEVNFAFSDLTPSELEPMVDAFEKVEYQKGETIAQQGEPDCFFYVVQNGEVSFNIDGKHVSNGKAGDVFGELALVYSCDRAAAVKAEEDQTALLRLHQTNYRHIRRHQVARSVSDRMKLLTKVPFFKEADEADLIQLSTAMVAHVFKANDNLTATFKEAPFCLIQQGSVTSSSNGSDYGPGGSFGEESLSGKDAGVSNVVALTDGVAYTIDRLSFEKVFGDMNRIALKSLDKKVLRGVRAIKAANITVSQLDKLARQIADKPFNSGENIFVINEDMIPSLYIVRKGRVKTVRKNGKEEIIAPGGHFGHEYLMVSSKGSRDSAPSHVKAKYTATAIEDSVCGVLTLQECVSVFGSESTNTNLDKTEYVALEDLTRHRILGEGHFGVVWLVTNRKSPKLDPYALKIQMLDDEEREAVNCIKEEISMMRQLHYPFIVKLINTYEDEESISMLLGLAPGGELFDQIHYQLPNGLWDSGIGEEKGRFYCSVVADTLSFMHIRGYIFRDLKPENVLIDKDGYPLLTDFGFTKHLKKNEKSYTMCGTPNYLPPEIIKNIGHGPPADNWSLGILIYEVVQGENPFYYEGLDQISLFHAICDEDYYPLPEDKISSDLEDLVDRLLEKNPSKRLGTFREKDIISHPWFADIDILKLRKKELEAPWVPDPVRLN